MRISDWSSDVCSSDLARIAGPGLFCQASYPGAQLPQITVTAVAAMACNHSNLQETGIRPRKQKTHGPTAPPENDQPAGPTRSRRTLTQPLRSEERRVGKEWFSTCIYG